MELTPNYAEALAGKIDNLLLIIKTLAYLAFLRVK